MSSQGSPEGQALAGATLAAPAGGATLAAPPAAGAAPGRRHPARSLGLVAGLLGAAWLLPVLTNALRIDWVLLVVLLLGAGSLLRAGYSLLDRMMLAGILLIGTLVAGGLLFSLWPWGLEPVPVTGTLLTAVIGAGLLTGRRPRLPTRICGSDAIIVGAGAFTAWVLLSPVLGRPTYSRLPVTTIAEDTYAHFALFDTIHRLGGYAFLHPARAGLSVAAPTQDVYPQGSHYLYAVLDIFLRSTTDPGPAAAEFSRYFDYKLAGFAFLVLAVTWSARWVAGPAMTGWRRVFICSVVAALAAAGPLSSLIGAGFDSETIGLALLALTVAVTARPAGRPQEQVLLVGSALIAVCYAYNLYAPLAFLGIVAAAVVYRRRLLRHWPFTVITAAVAVPAALLPTAIAAFSGFKAVTQLNVSGGDLFGMSRSIFAGLALVIVASMATRAGRRSPVWQVLVATVGLAAAALVALWIYQARTVGGTSPYYYFDKALTGGYVMCLVGFGAAGLLLRPARDGKSAAQQPRWRTDLLPGLAAGLIAVTFISGFPWGIPAIRGTGPPGYRATWAYAWWSGKVSSGIGPALQALDRAHLLGTGKPTLILFSNWGFLNWQASFFDAVLNRDLGSMLATFNPLLTAGTVIDTGSRARATLGHGVGIVEEAISKGPRHLHMVVSDQGLENTLRSFARAHPSLGLTVDYLPQLH
jgi:hypothetical protein